MGGPFADHFPHLAHNNDSGPFDTEHTPRHGFKSFVFWSCE
jgi:hypothetical protein